ncbi:MAG: CYTH domain-containing protein [Candidatus Poribacteria bacterium]
MQKKVEFKAYCSNPEKVSTICQSIGARLICQDRQTDTYFSVSSVGRLKLRQSNKYGGSFIYYERLDSPTPRESSFIIVPTASDVSPLLSLFSKAIGIRTVVHKKRDTYGWDNSFVNIDYVKGLGNFIEIEVDIERAGSFSRALQIAEKLKRLLEISQADILSWSYAELKVMCEASSHWHAELARTHKRGTLFLLDGASGSGKTTLARRLLDNSELYLTFVPRYCTRSPRQNETTESEYVFVSHEEFTNLAATGAFIEYREFKFGMSYGLPWRQAIAPLMAGSNALGIMSLGSVRHVKNIFPEAITILVNASVTTIRNRLEARGANTREQIEERVENARTVDAYKGFYDYVIDNDDGMLDQAEASIKRIIKSYESLTASKNPWVE